MPFSALKSSGSSTYLHWFGVLPILVSLALGTASTASAQLLPGFTLTGESWTYAEAGQTTITGILKKPTGNGPFPAVIISHGKGPGLFFTQGKAAEMVQWGFVCIGARYTHAMDDPEFPDNLVAGARTENLRRASACLRILQSLPYVRGNRICAYGNSMGAFVTIGLCGQKSDQLRAAAITAGGIIPSGDAAEPNVAEASPIRTPFLILHGEDDTTVYPQDSALLKQTLDNNGVLNERVTYPGIGHDLHQVMANDVYGRIQTFFTARGLFAQESARVPDRPYGIYVLDSSQGTAYNGSTLRDANIRSHNFVRGYALRVAWSFVEPTEGAYDFTIIDNILAKLPAGQKLSLIIVPNDPPYIASTAGVVTWMDEDRFGNPLQRAVPWDLFARERRRAFLQALASHVTSGTAFRDQPALDVIDPYLPGGFTGIRDPNTTPLRNLPGYSRALLLESVKDELRTLTAQFPNQFIQIGFWKVTDTEGGTDAWEEIRQSLLSEFDGALRPKVGFFMENLAASRPAPGVNPLTGYPVTSFGSPLHLSQSQTWTAFQALTSWIAPFTGPDKVANATPADGISFAFNTYGSRYFELYVNDIDNSPWHADFESWSDALVPSTSGVTDWNLYGG